MSDETYYPPPAFFFAVHLVGPMGAQNLVPVHGADASFSEVTGLQSEFATEEVREGGQNRYVHKLPTAPKYPNLVLKRGVVVKGSDIADWVKDTLESGLQVPIRPQNVQVSLLDRSSYPVVVWWFSNAWPVKWETGPLNSTDNKILIETLEISYNYMERFTYA